MSKPTGKLLLAYQTISTMEEKISALQLRLNASDGRNAELERVLGGMLFAFDDGVGQDWSAPLLDYARKQCKAVEYVAQSAPATDEQGAGS